MLKIELIKEPTRLLFKITSPLLKDYYNNFYGMFTEDKQKSSEFKLERYDTESIGISIDLKLESIDSEKEEDSENNESYSINSGSVMGLGINSSELESKFRYVIELTNKFCINAIQSIKKSSEFCPILDFSGGYSYNQLKKDVLEGKKQKRDFLLIDTYKEFLRSYCSPDCNFTFNQYRIPYGTSEYCDFLLDVLSGDKNTLMKLYKDKLKSTSWL